MDSLASRDIYGKSLRLLCLHGHGGEGSRFCNQLKDVFFKAINTPDAPVIDVSCRCIDAPFPETSTYKRGRQWWRYDDNQNGDRPVDWAEMEFATTKIAEELNSANEPYDGVLGFSQGAEMVHTLALLAHRGDPRMQGPFAPRFAISLSGAVNPGHFEAPGGGGPPLGCPGPTVGPHLGVVLNKKL